MPTVQACWMAPDNKSSQPIKCTLDVRIEKLERKLLGVVYRNGGWIPRIAALEQFHYGQKQVGPLPERIKNLELVLMDC